MLTPLILLLTWSLSLVAEDFNSVIVTPIKIITQADLPYTISDEGTYWLGSNLSYAPVATGTNAINISASNVTLDLKNYIISQANGVGGTNGIGLTGSFNNITIRNGSIKNLSSFGITTGNSAVERLVFLNLRFVNCVLGGITLGGSASTDLVSAVTIDKCTFDNCAFFFGIATVSVIGLFNTDLVRIRNCTITNCGNPLNQSTTTFRGIGANIEGGTTTSVNTYIENVAINGNFAGNGTMVGIHLLNCTNSRVVRCSFNNNTGNNSSTCFMHGFATGSVSTNNLTDLSSYSHFIDCESINNSAGQYRMFWTKGAAVMRNCIAANNAATNSFMRVFDLNGTDNIVADCIVQGCSCITTPGVADYGFGFFPGCVTSGFIRCIAARNTTDRAFDLNATTPGGPTSCVVAECMAIANTGRGIGFTSVPPIVPATTRCVATGNGISNFGATFPAGGRQSAANIGLIIGNLTNSWTNIGIQ